MKVKTDKMVFLDGVLRPAGSVFVTGKLMVGFKEEVPEGSGGGDPAPSPIPEGGV